jgi:hypothetical protein
MEIRGLLEIQVLLEILEHRALMDPLVIKDIKGHREILELLE